MSDNLSDRRRRARRSLSADDSNGSIRSALIEHKSDGNLSQKSDAKKKKKKSDDVTKKSNAGSDPAGNDEAAPIPFYFSPTRFEGNWSECATALGAAGHYHTMPNPGRHEIPPFSKRLFGSGRVGGPPPPPPGPPSFLPDGSLLTMYDSRRVPMSVRPPMTSPHHHHHHHPYHHGVAGAGPQYPLYKRPLVGECYYTPPQPEYYQRQPPPPHIHVHLPQRHFWQDPPVDYARTLGRTRREAPVGNQTRYQSPHTTL